MPILTDIKDAITNKRLQPKFRAEDVRLACPGWSYGTYSVFLPKHRVGNPNRNTELFEQVERGLYRLVGDPNVG